MLWKIQALEDFLNKAFAAAKEELSQPMQMITLCHFDITQLFYWTSMHAISSRITCSSSQGPLHGSIAWVHCMGPLHGSIASLILLPRADENRSSAVYAGTD
jgi:hypothetical protein